MATATTTNILVLWLKTFSKRMTYVVLEQKEKEEHTTTAIVEHIDP